MSVARASSMVFFGVSLATLWAALTMPIGDLGTPGPGFLPLLLGVFMVGTSGGLVVGELRRPSARSAEASAPGAARRVTLFVVALIAYCVLLPVVGFLPLTFLLQVGLLRLLGVSRAGTVLLIAALATGVSYFLFERWLGVPFPQGWWWPN